ncbi:MAG: hypothetical protein H8E20_09675 [Verrucomicrobia bacterium]|nr:hypothetical protein [Verrucomicrobiota bacterium]
MKTKQTIMTTVTAATLMALAGCGGSSSDSDSSTSAGPSAVKNSFAEVSAKLDPNGSLFLYYSTEDVLETVEKYTDALIGFANEAVGSGAAGFRPGQQERAMIDAGTKVSKAIYDQLGVREISGIGLSSFEFEKGLQRNKTVIHHFPEKADGKLWSLFGSEPHEIGMLKMLPDNTALALSHEFNAKALMEWLPELVKASGDEAMQQQFDMAMQMADASIQLRDLVGSFGNEVGLFVTLDESQQLPLPPEVGGAIPMPGFGLVVRLNGDTIPNMLFEALESAGAPLEIKTVSGIEMRVITEPAPIPVPLAPAIFRLGDYLVAANTEALAKRMVAVHSGDESGLTGTDEFQRLAKGLDLKGNHFFFASEQIGKTVAPIIEAAMAAQPLPPGFPEIDWAAAYNMQTLGLIRVEPDGFVMENHSTSGLFNSVAMQAGVVPVAVGAGMLLPALAKAKAKAQRISCINNLKQIGIATRIYATDNQDRFPWQVAQAEGGSAEFAKRSNTDAVLDSNGQPIFDANAWRHFQALSNELQNPKILRCPRDTRPTLVQANSILSEKPRGAAGNRVIPFGKDAVSYWLRTDPEVDEARPNQIVAVCPHHDGSFNVLLADSSVQQTSWTRLRQYFADISIQLQRRPWQQ